MGVHVKVELVDGRETVEQAHFFDAFAVDLFEMLFVSQAGWW